MDWEKGKGGSRGKGVPKENGPILVTFGTVLGTIHIGTGKRRVLRWIRGRLSNLFHISVRSVRAQVARSCRNRNASRDERTLKRRSLEVQ